MSETATSEEECRDECPDGEHLSSSGSCQPCPAGSYRTRGEHKQCVSCPPGTTTESTASTRREQCNTPRCKVGQFLVKETEQCNTPRCKVGQFLVKETKHCQFCPRGTFQDEEQKSTCKLCPTDHTTASQGATAESQCYSTNQCATGEDNCSWHAHCIDLPDDNDVPSFQCKCKPGYRGGIVAVLIVIVIVIFMISFRFNRSTVDAIDKVQIDDLQQSNFIYGRPPIGKLYF
ncbi:unnamed protein product [Strongylus vulgaris]|uniref:EGF-like domain-containing protein n=1 Tax=Strongylus vulgaris TaxID=40348 RepID=A0A3P7J7F5_STRVU|nr:unnamed protein product [Strongylus vulgaris]